jgi:nitrous oxidase accessory protein NosD
VRGFTVRGFAGFGVYLACVEDFRIERNVAEADRTYSIFPVASRRGRMSRNVASGTRSDACLYVGQDDRVLVDRNRATDCIIGLQIENATHVRMRNNLAEGNTAGVIVDVIDGRQTTVASENELVRNVIRDNNRPNDAPPGAETAQIVPGIGIIVNGADRTLIRANRIEDNHLAGLSLLDFCLGMPDECARPGLAIDPKPDGNRVVGNRFARNGIDVIYEPRGGQGNCFARNRPRTLTGPPLPACD